MTNLASTSAKSAPLIKAGLFGRLISATTAQATTVDLDSPPNGTLEEMIVSGAAFGETKIALRMQYLIRP